MRATGVGMSIQQRHTPRSLQVVTVCAPLCAEIAEQVLSSVLRRVIDVGSHGQSRSRASRVAPSWSTSTPHAVPPQSDDRAFTRPLAPSTFSSHTQNPRHCARSKSTRAKILPDHSCTNRSWHACPVAPVGDAPPSVFSVRRKPRRARTASTLKPPCWPPQPPR